MADLPDKPGDEQKKAEAENGAEEQQEIEPMKVMFQPERLTASLKPQENPVITSLRQRLTEEEFVQLMSKYSNWFILQWAEQHGEDAVVALVRKESTPIFSEIQPAPILTGRLDEPVEALHPIIREESQVQPAKKQLSETEKKRLLASARERLGDELFDYEQRQIGDDNLALMMDQLGEEQAVKLIRRIAGSVVNGYPCLRSRAVPEPPPEPIRRPAKKVRTREMGSTLNDRVLQVALIYAVLIGGFYPDFSAYYQVYESILPIAAIGFLIVAVINFIRTMSFSFEVILTQAFIVSITLGIVFGIVVNLVNLGVRTLGAAGIAFTGAFLVGMLLGKPIFRWIERRQMEDRHGLYVGIGVVLGLAVLIAGWWGIDYLVKLLLR